MKLAIFDIDGTLADDFSQFESADSFYSYSVLINLTPFLSVLDLVKQYTEMKDVAVVFLTARPNSVETVTFEWLQKVIGNLNWSLYTRGTNISRLSIVPYKLAKIIDLKSTLKPDVVEIYENEMAFLQVADTVFNSNVQLFKCQDGMIFKFRG